jgi:diamine N-acetyltransferase
VTEPVTEPVIWLRGERVGIGPLRADLVPAYWEWENDPQAILGYGRQVPDSLENRTEGYGHQVSNALSQLRFTVYDTEQTPVPAGLSTLLIDHQVRTAEFLILLGHGARGRGMATEATLLTLDYGFHVAALRMIWLKVLEPNTAGLRAYNSAGFKPAGRLRQAGYWLGEACDELIMDALREDYPGPSHLASKLQG